MFVQLHIVTNAVNHKPHSLMTVPAFVYHMEISGQLPTVFTAHFFQSFVWHVFDSGWAPFHVCLSLVRSVEGEQLAEIQSA